MSTEKRLPKTGDVYCEVWSTHWSALQIVLVSEDSNVLVFMDLDWYSEKKMTPEDLENVVPLKRNRFSMENQLSISTVGFDNILQTELPSNKFHFIGNKPLEQGIVVKTNGFQSEVTWQNFTGEDHGRSSDWPHSDAAMEKWWSDFPESERDNYKKCYKLNQDISLFGQQLNSCDSEIFIPDNAVQDWSILDSFGCLTSLKCEGRQDGLTDYLKKRSLIEYLDWKNCAHEKIDTSNANVNWLHKISIGGSQLKELILDSGMNYLYLEKKLNPELKIIHADQGKNLAITFWHNLVDGVVPNLNLPHLKALTIFSTCIDAATIAASYPNLEDIDLRGELGIIKNIAELGKLKELKKLNLFDLFGYTSDEFPVRSQWSKLESIYIQTYPAELAKKLKTEFSDCKEYTVKMPKKPEWITENLDNPFRNWEGREISGGKIKKALTAYKKVNVEIRNLKKPAEKTKLIPVLKEFTESINKISDVIDTIEREEVYDIYQEVLTKAEVFNDRETYNTLFDEWRDF